jgi:hypothetical protein
MALTKIDLVDMIYSELDIPKKECINLVGFNHYRGEGNMKFSKVINFLMVFVPLLILTLFPLNAFAEKSDKDLAKKMAVATYYESALKQQYGMAFVRVRGSKNEILFISMVRVTDDRIAAVLKSGLYKEARKAKFRKIIFQDAGEEQTVVNIK